MKNPPMRFCGISLHHNPEKLSIALEDNMYELISPCCEPDSLSLGAKLRRISGEGELFGEDCLQQFKTLQNLQKTHRRAKLILPQFQPMYAYLYKLSVVAEPVDNVLSYSFSFIEAQFESVASDKPRYYTVTKNGESLWDIAYKKGITVDRLLKLNPHIQRINELELSERVRLC